MEATAEEHVDPLIDQHESPAITLFGIDARMRLAHSRRDLPVDVAHVVTGLVHAQLIEIEAPPAQTRSIQSREWTMARLAGQKAEALGVATESGQISNPNIGAARRRHLHAGVRQLGVDARGGSEGVHRRQS